MAANQHFTLTKQQVGESAFLPLRPRDYNPPASNLTIS